jgi:phosphoserine phosphatase
MPPFVKPQPYAVTLIAAEPRVDFMRFAGDCVGEMKTLGVEMSALTALHPEQAGDFVATPPSPDALRVALGRFIGGEKIDVIVQPAANRRKKFLLADMESTIIQQEMLEEMADAIEARAHVAEVTRRAMNGEIDFKTALRERVALFAGQPESLLEKMAKRITPMPGAKTLVATMRAHGATCWLASGGFRYYTQRVAKQFGFDMESANELLIENGLLTGAVAEPILDKAAKLDIFNRGLTTLNITAADTMVVGDGANDLAMINASTAGAGLGIAFHAKPSVVASATHSVHCADLTALLYAQGYRYEEFTGTA